MEHFHTVDHIKHVSGSNPYITFIVMVAMLTVGVMAGVADVINSLNGKEIPHIIIQIFQLMAFLATIFAGLFQIFRKPKK